MMLYQVCTTAGYIDSGELIEAATAEDAANQWFVANPKGWDTVEVKPEIKAKPGEVVRVEKFHRPASE